MSHLLPNIYPHNIITISAVHFVKTHIHLLFSTKRLDDAQATQRFLHLTHCVAPQCLCLNRVLFQLSPHIPHKPTKNWNENQRKKRELPRHDDQCGKIGDDKNGIFKQHVKRRHDRTLDFLHIAAHPCNNITLAFFREKTERQRRDLLIQLIANIAHYPCPNRDN